MIYLIYEFNYLHALNVTCPFNSDMQKEKPKIFINYRIDLSEKEACLLELMLEAHFPGMVFRDKDSIEGGDIWKKELDDALEHAHVMLSLIPEDWIYYPVSKEYYEKYPNSLSEYSQLYKEKCHVKKEIKIALEKGPEQIKIIPILLNGAKMPRTEELPESIQPLFETFNVANRGKSLDFNKPNVLEFKELFDLIAAKAGLTINSNSLNENLYQEPLATQFNLPTELADFLPESPSPFVGLRPFERKDARLFFGRSREVYNLCYKIIKEDTKRLILIDGYSGTGKSSLLQAGLIPRIEAQNWAVAYRRREEDEKNGLKGVFELLLKDVAQSPKSQKLLILDQVEEGVSNRIKDGPNELEQLAVLLKEAWIQHPNYKFILGFRSEQTRTITKALLDQGLIFVDKNSLFPLERLGAIEAVSGVANNKDLNNLKYHLSFKPTNLPETIVERLFSGRDNNHIAPLLQVNMELLWQLSLQDGASEIKNTERFIERQEDLLEHYLLKVREKFSKGFADDLKILKILSFYIQNEPASAIRLDEEFAQHEDFSSDKAADILLQELKEVYLLSPVNAGGKTATRLAHDVLAPVIQQQFQRRSDIRLDETQLRQFDLLIEKLSRYLYSLKYEQAQVTLQEIFNLNIRRDELRIFLLELLYFWNEVGHEEYVISNLNMLYNGNLLWSTGKTFTQSLLKNPDRKNVRVLLKGIDIKQFEDLEVQYYYPENSELTFIDDGIFELELEGKKLAVLIDKYFLSIAPTTFRKYGLYLFATNQESRLTNMAPSWRINADHPVINVNWYDAIEYCNWLSHVQGLEKVYDINKSTIDPNNNSLEDQLKWLVRENIHANGFRLPTGAQWEYAARGGQNSNGFQFAGSIDLREVGWFEENAEYQTHPVNKLKPNELGLFDMSGNVWEWCQDWEDDNEKSLPAGFNGLEVGSYRVIRGGSWLNIQERCRIDYRNNSLDPDSRNDFVGFRPLRRINF